MLPRAIARPALLIALLCGAHPVAARVTVERDGLDRITRLVIDNGGIRHTSGGSYTVEALPGADVRGGAARLFWEMEVPLALGGGVVRAEGLPIASAAPLARDESTGAAAAPDPGTPRPSAAVFAALSIPSQAELRFALICATSVGFGDPAIGTFCDSLWLTCAYGDHLALQPQPDDVYREVPVERSAHDEALLGCGAAYGTSCEQDGIDLRLADASVVYQRFPGFETVLPDGGSSDVLQRFAWNWFAAELMRRGVAPGVGEATGCTFETPAGCASFSVSGPRFPARRVLPDEPIAGPDIRWEWELGTTFELGPIEVEGDVSPDLLAFLADAGVQRVHVAGPFAGADDAPDAAVYWVPEPVPALGHAGAAIALLWLRRRRAH